MKKALLLSVVLLSGCALFSGVDDDGMYGDDELLIDEETGFEEAPAVKADFEEMEPWDREAYAVRVQKQEEAARSSQKVTIPQATLSADGTVIELPAQEIYIGDWNQAPTAMPAPQQPNMLSYSQPFAPTVRPNYEAKAVVITLQNREYPNTYAQCMSTDTGCLSAYEQQGYVRVKGLPHFAGYRDVPANSDYPGNGRWRNNNNIPRW